MQLAKLPSTLAEKVDCLIQPIVPGRAAMNRQPSASTDLDLQNRWQPVLAQLTQWKNYADSVADEGVIAPSVELVASAEDVAAALCTRRVEPPDYLLTNGDGGVVFRWRSADRLWSIEIDDDGSIESSLIADSKLLWRHSIHQPPVETV